MPFVRLQFLLETESTGAWQRAGERLGKFELLDAVGQGAFGTVYKRDPELDRTVAVKLPRAGNLAGPKELDCFLAKPVRWHNSAILPLSPSTRSARATACPSSNT